MMATVMASRMLFDVITLYRSHATVDKVIIPWIANKHMLIAYKLQPVIKKKLSLNTYEKFIKR